MDIGNQGPKLGEDTCFVLFITTPPPEPGAHTNGAQ